MAKSRSAGGMQPADIAEMIEVGDPRLSPDGSRVAFVVTTMDLDANEYRSRIWVAAVDGSTPPRPVTAGEKRDGRPRWSPDGSRLAFVSHREEKGSGLYVLPIDGGGEVVRLASWPEEIDDLAWSPDGRRIAFGARARDEERYGKDKAKDQPPRRITNLFYRLDSVGWTVDRPRKLFVVDTDAVGKPVQLTDGPAQDGGLAWTPDGRSLLFSSSRHDNWDLDRATDLFSVPADGGKVKRLTATGMSRGRPSVSADGKRVAFVVNEDPSVSPANSEVGVLELKSGNEQVLTATLDRNCQPSLAGAGAPVWSGGDLYFQAEDHGNVPLYRVAADGSGKPELVLGGDRVVTGFDVRNGVIALTMATATTLSELYVLDGDEPRQLTSLGERFTADREIVAPERFTAVSADGEEVEAWLIRPAGFKDGKRYPVLLNIHGGPFSQYANKLFDEFQVEAGAGYAVLYANPRGSSGYGNAAAQSIRGRTAKVKPGTGWGGVDYDDLMAVVDTALDRFAFLDGERLGVLGGSYGGYMTTWIAGHTNRFKAACSERACNDLVALDASCDIATAFRSWVGASYLDDPDEWRRQSPITYVANITTPMLVLHSEEDLRCPIAQADALFSSLRLLGREVEMVRFPGESHELSRSGAPRHRVQRMDVILEWFSRYLQ
jgi:dipeptidyl aminopeptidase/acylaminoacyl peptidase